MFSDVGLNENRVCRQTNAKSSSARTLILDFTPLSRIWPFVVLAGTDFGRFSDPHVYAFVSHSSDTSRRRSVARHIVSGLRSRRFGAKQSRDLISH